jgi:hypothetical protein
MRAKNQSTDGLIYRATKGNGTHSANSARALCVDETKIAD